MNRKSALSYSGMKEKKKLHRDTLEVHDLRLNVSGVRNKSNRNLNVLTSDATGGSSGRGRLACASAMRSALLC
jgi:hypothetical protein